VIFVSSSCVKHSKISHSVKELAEHGFKNIELSGGTDYYKNYIKDLIDLKKKYNLNYFIHNYFPPPEQHFVLNLASLNQTIFDNTINHFKISIDLAKKLDIDRIGVHAGFYIDPNVNELGHNISKTTINNRRKAIDRFINGYSSLKRYGDDVIIYVENNVISKRNFKTYKTNPFMLTNLADYHELKDRIDFPLLLDVAHLKVSCKTLDLGFEYELSELLEHSDYIHISDNNGESDTNNPIDENSYMLQYLKTSRLDNKKITLEIYDDIYKLRKSFKIIANMEDFIK